MSVKNCFSKSKNKQLKALFNKKLKEGMSEDIAAVASIQEYSDQLAEKLTSLTGVQGNPLKGDFTRRTELKEVSKEVASKGVRIVDVVEKVATLKGQRNKVFKLFADVLKSPKYYKEMMTSIDNDTFKEGSLSMLTDIEDEAYDIYGPLGSMTRKFAFKIGKMGVAEGANSLSDHVLTQNKEVRTYFKQGTWGNKFLDARNSEILSEKELDALVDHINKLRSKNDKDLISKDERNELRSIKISGTLSEITNAFVDIANEKAYVTRANWGSLLNGYGMMMIRQGVHPHKVSALFTQPAMKDLTRSITLKEGIIDGESSFQIEKDLLKKYKDNLKLYGIEVPKAPKLSDIDFTTALSVAKSQDSREGALIQYIVLKNYMDNKETIKKYNAFVTSAKTDAKGAGRDLGDMLVRLNAFSNSFIFNKKNGLENVKQKYFDAAGNPTLAYTTYKNTVEFMLSFMDNNPLLFNGINKKTFSAFNKIATVSRNNERLDSRVAADYIMSQFEAYKLSFYAPLHRNDSGIPEADFKAQIRKFKKGNKYKIITKLLEEDGMFFLDRVSTKDVSVKNKLTDSWRLLLRDNKPLGDYLVRKAFEQSKFLPSPKQFHELIPFEWFLDNEYLEFVKEDTTTPNAEFVKYMMADPKRGEFFKFLNNGTSVTLNSNPYMMVDISKPTGLGNLGKGTPAYTPPVYGLVGDSAYKLVDIAVVTLDIDKEEKQIYQAVYSDLFSPTDNARRDIKKAYEKAKKIRFIDVKDAVREIPVLMDLVAAREQEERNFITEANTTPDDVENNEC